ncbi:hypothetical protein MauCBS54593_005771 [Microsporum audouinii]
MLSHRRLRVYLVSAAILVCFILYFTGDVRRSQALRSSSKIGIVNTKGSGNHGKGNDASVFEKLKPGSLRPDEHHTDESATEVDKTDAARQTVIPGQKETQTQDTESRDESVKEELNSILKRSPIIIFSKSYCPFSKKAKFYLLEKYDITPAPFVVELDEHPLGKELQGLLATNTGRKTVPNILVNGKTIGGGDEIETLYTSGELGTKLQSLGGKRVTATLRKTEGPEP